MSSWQPAALSQVGIKFHGLDFCIHEMIGGFTGNFCSVDSFVLLPYSCYSISWQVFLVLCYYQLLLIQLYQCHSSLGIFMFSVIILPGCQNFGCQNIPEKYKLKRGFVMLHNMRIVHYRIRATLSLAIVAVEMQNNIVKYFQRYAQPSPVLKCALGSAVDSVMYCMLAGYQSSLLYYFSFLYPQLTYFKLKHEGKFAKTQEVFQVVEFLYFDQSSISC